MGGEPPIAFLVECWCDDCTGQDFMGCNDGEGWTLGPFDTREEAEKAGHDETDNTGPWRFEVKEVPVQPTDQPPA